MQKTYPMTQHSVPWKALKASCQARHQTSMCPFEPELAFQTSHCHAKVKHYRICMKLHTERKTNTLGNRNKHGGPSINRVEKQRFFVFVERVHEGRQLTQRMDALLGISRKSSEKWCEGLDRHHGFIHLLKTCMLSWWTFLGQCMLQLNAPHYLFICSQ